MTISDDNRSATVHRWISGNRLHCRLACDGIAHFGQRAGLAAVCDRDMDRARAFAARHGITRVYDSLGTMLKEGGLGAIHVLVPPELHAQTALARSSTPD